MRAHAIVIGIDRYTKPEWCLTGAVRDAIAFAQWAVAAGGVDPADLTLLLSPRPDDPPLAERLKAAGGAPDLSSRAGPATRDRIAKALYAYQTGRGKDGDRLWFYYGGHGLAPPAQATTAGPLVVPADVEDLDYYVNVEPVGLEIFRGAMEDVAPKEQFYFVDACRDVLPPIGNKVLSQQLVWDVRNIDDEKLATQVIFLATTAGQRAKELRGHGLFGRALLAALRGLGPQLRPPAAPTSPGQVPRRRLVLDDLIAFVKDAVTRALKDLPGIAPSELKGLPYARVNRLTGDVVVAEFAANQLPTAKLTAIVDPGGARPSARIEFLQWSDDEDRWIPRASNPAPVGPPVPEQATFELRGGSHHLHVTASGFEVADKEVLVYEDKRIPIELRPAVPPVATAVPRGAEILESTLESLEPRARTGTLIVRSSDALARVSVVDGGGKERGRAYGELTLPDLSPNPYRVVAELTSSQRTEEIVQVRAGETSERILQIPGAPLSPALAQGLAHHGIRVDANHSYPSENFGPVANARLGSVLAYAAWAARWPPSQGFHRLRGIGVDPIPGLTARDSAVQVLIGDLAGSDAGRVRVQLEPAASGGAPLPTATGHTVIESAVVEARGRSVLSRPLSLSPIGGLPIAQQASAVVAPGSMRVRVELPDFAAASFAVALLPGFVTVLVVSREDDWDVDVQQYLNPVDPMAPVAEGFDPPLQDDVRLVELAWRALEGRDPLDAVEHKGLVDGKRSNPLLGVIAGYRMLRTDRADQFRVSPQPPSQPGKTRSPLWNLVRFFPGLPDVHVLAGLYDPERRAEHFERAMRVGTPVLVEGFWALVDWLTSSAMRAGAVPPTLCHTVLPGTVWTAFTDPAPAPAVEAVHILPNAGRPVLGDRSDPRVLALASSVGRLEEDGAGAFLCSAFLVAPQIVACPIHFASRFAREQADGSWALRGSLRVRFDLRDPARDRVVTRVVRMLRPPAGASIDGGTIGRDRLDRCWPVLLELSEPAAGQVLGLGGRAPELGQRVAVIGFPSDVRVPSGSFAQHFAGSAGEKHFMPGTVVRAPGEGWTFDHDCFTADGTSGGPVVDLETGAVLGVHVAGFQPSEGRMRGVAVALTRFASEWP